MFVRPELVACYYCFRETTSLEWPYLTVPGPNFGGPLVKHKASQEKRKTVKLQLRMHVTRPNAKVGLRLQRWVVQLREQVRVRLLPQVKTPMAPIFGKSLQQTLRTVLVS